MREQVGLLMIEGVYLFYISYFPVSQQCLKDFFRHSRLFPLAGRFEIRGQMNNTRPQLAAAII